MTKRLSFESLPRRGAKRTKIARILAQPSEDADVPNTAADLDDVITPTVQETDERTYSSARGRKNERDITDPDGWVGILDDS